MIRYEGWFRSAVDVGLDLEDVDISFFCKREELRRSVRHHAHMVHYIVALHLLSTWPATTNTCILATPLRRAHTVSAAELAEQG